MSTSNLVDQRGGVAPAHPLHRARPGSDDRAPQADPSPGGAPYAQGAASRLPDVSLMGAGLVVLFGAAALLQSTIIPLLIATPSAALWLEPEVGASFMLSGIALFLLRRGPPQRLSRVLARICAAGVLLLAALAVARGALAFSAGVHSPLGGIAAELAEAPGPMTLSTALDFALLAGALALFDARPRWAQALTLVALLMTLLMLTARLYEVDLPLGSAGPVAMRPRVAVVFVVLCVAALLARPEYGFVGVLNSSSRAGVAARRLLPAMALALLGVGWLALFGARAGYYGPEFALVLFAAVSSICLLGLVGWHAAVLLRMDVARGQAEAKVRISEERLLSSSRREEEVNALLSSVVESSNDAIITEALDGTITSWNRAAEELFGYTAAEATGRNIALILPEGVRSDHPTTLRQIASGKPVHQEETVRLRKDGSLVEVSITMSPIKGRSGAVTGASKIVRNISYRGAHERQLEAALREKTVLLNEVHHRVKNNLQVIASLLFLQSRYTQSPEVKAAFEESQGRVKAMALIHQLLYESKDFSQVRMRDYLRRLGQLLAGTYAARGDGITVQVDADDVAIDLTRAIPCGLLVNELVFNSFKYAFPDRRGEIGIELRRDRGDGLARLTVRDNGVGLPEGMDPKAAKTLGMQLVWQLAEQIGATVRVGEGPGACFELCFSLTSPENQYEPGEDTGR